MFINKIATFLSQGLFKNAQTYLADRVNFELKHDVIKNVVVCFLPDVERYNVSILCADDADHLIAKTIQLGDIKFYVCAEDEDTTDSVITALKTLSRNSEYSQGIVVRLNAWREERRLEVSGQREGIVSNLIEEFAEFFNAMSDEERVDAICDISVFSLNCDWKKEEVIWRKALEIDEDLVNTLPTREKCIIYTEAIKYYALGRDYEQQYKYSVLACEAMGYDFEKCMDETLKEIEDRTGHFDESINKFVKDKKEDRYKADYSKCKLADV